MLLLYVSKSPAVAILTVSTPFLVSCSWNSVALEKKTNPLGFFCHLVSLARSSFVLIVNVPRTMRSSMPVLNPLITDTSGQCEVCL